MPVPGGSVLHIRRRYDTEKKRLLELRKAGLQVVPASGGHARHTLPETLLALPDVDVWPDFVDETLPALSKRDGA